MTESTTINPKLIKIQKDLKAPKSEFNDFAKFPYRSAENILEAVKPLVHAEGLSLTLDDEVVNIGQSNYVKATAILSDGLNSISVKAYAREEISKKGMDTAQITGSTSSYARKYALSGLFAIDDNKDADSQDNTNHTSAKATPNKMASPEQRATIKAKLDKIGISTEESGGYLIEQFGVKLPLDSESADFVIESLIAN